MYRLRLSEGELTALRDVSEAHGVGMSAWVTEATAVCAAMAEPGGPLPDRVAVDHASGVRMAWHAGNADRLMDSALRLRREAEGALATAAGGVAGYLASQPRHVHVPRQDAERAVAAAAQDVSDLLRGVSVRVADALDETRDASAWLERVLETGLLGMPARRAVPHRDALPRTSRAVREAVLEEDPCDFEVDALLAGAAPAREFPPAVALSRVGTGGRRDAQLQLRVGEGELEHLGAIAARLGLPASELVRHAAWAYVAVMDPEAVRADRAAVDYGEWRRVDYFLSCVEDAAAELLSWAGGLPTRLEVAVRAFPTPQQHAYAVRSASDLGEAASELSATCASVLERFGSLDEGASADLMHLRRPEFGMLLPQTPWWEDGER